MPQIVHHKLHNDATFQAIASGFLDFFNTATKTSKGANSIHETFVVAKNLKPKQIKSFRIMVKLPAKFTNVSEHAKVYGH